jgi:hypothetical protein
MAHAIRAGRMALRIAAVVFAAGCASSPPARKDLLDFLDQASVTGDQVRQHLGEPSATFEKERVLTYRLSHNTGGYYICPPKSGWEGVQYDLVVVLDERNVVQRHRLVTIRQP